MLGTQTVLLLIGILMGVLLSLVGWSMIQTRSAVSNDTSIDAQHQMLLWFLLAAMFMVGAFFAFVLLKI